MINNHSVTEPKPLIFLEYDIAQSFENPPETKHSVTEPGAQILLVSDSLTCQHKNRIHRPCQKLPPPVKEYLFFQMGGKLAHYAQCYKSHE